MAPILIGGLFVLAVLSGMLGLGVAFAAVPFLSFFMADLVHQVQPLSLLLNGITALFSVFGFAVSGMVDWRKAVALSVVTTIVAPFGAWLVQFAPALYVWAIYFIAVAFLAYRLFRPVQPRETGTERFGVAMALAVPISLLSGLVGGKDPSPPLRSHLRGDAVADLGRSTSLIRPKLFLTEEEVLDA
jgi:uncharacterized membrane protein YfcA